MSLGGGNGLGMVLVHEGRGEACPSGEIDGVDGLSLGGYHRAKTGAVQIND